MTDQEVMNEFTRLHREILALKAENARLAAQSAAPVGEPVAWAERIGGKFISVRMEKSIHCTIPLYAAPPPSPPQVTKEQIAAIIDAAWKKNRDVPFPLYQRELDSIADDLLAALSVKPGEQT